jgi:hypothetical protein
MIITVILNKQVLSMVAPLGAAAFTTEEDGVKAKVIFAMMQNVKGTPELGIDTYNRVTENDYGYHWLPVAARPEEQQCAEFGSDPFVAYSFLIQSGSIVPANNSVANFMQVMSKLQSLPKLPPKDLAFNMGGQKGQKANHPITS